jgi:flagellar operon protein
MSKPIQLDPKMQAALPATPVRLRQQPQPASAGSFASTLEQAQDLKFSTHAQKRLEKRDIALTDDGLSRLAQAVDKVEKRGGRESLVLMDGLAFIVNVQQRLVVTAIDAESRREGVFTQIDSVVLADGEE